MKLKLLALILTIAATPVAGSDLSGFMSFEMRTFAHDGQFDRQPGESVSLALEPEYYNDWDDGSQQLIFRPFARIDSEDTERTHFDLRELYWLRTWNDWELSVGFRQVFWGVTESRHLVDIINQTDLVEDPDGEQKLGQPMIMGRLIRSWGTVDLFLLTGFRERTFPGQNGRFRAGLVVDSDESLYESADGASHIDWAVRWSRYLGPLDIGVSHFSGTSRDPAFLPALDDAGESFLVPFYELIDQTGLDMQLTSGPALWKLEAIRRHDSAETYAAATGGIEYTFSDVRSTGLDIGMIAEYLWDDRGDQATTPFADDVFAGARFALNDVQSTQILVGAIIDTTSGATFYNLEASRRIATNWKIEIRARVFSGVPDNDILTPLRRDDYLQVELARYFH